jgi:hypothetical protein
MKILTLFAVFGFLAIAAAAQDPVKTLPDNYKLQFENDWVKVTRVYYPPQAKIAAHAHTQMGSAYVYLNDSDPVIFKHIGAQYGAIKRPATKAGSFRLYKAVQEVHEVENPSDKPSDFLRIEFKTEPVNEKSLYGRFFREEYPAGENFQKVQFENEQVRITRLVCPKGKRLEIITSATEPALLVALSPAHLKSNDSETLMEKLALGQTKWMKAGNIRLFENIGDAPVEMLRFDFKTKPLAKEEIEKSKKHDHSGA